MTGLFFALGFLVIGAIADSYWEDRLKADRDRHSLNATTLEKIQELQYVSAKEFRDATAGRIVLEAGSGRTRAETNNPANTGAMGGTT